MQPVALRLPVGHELPRPACCGVVLALLILTGCGGEPPPSLIQQASEQAGAGGTAYVKHEGLHVDIPYLMGKQLDGLPPAVIADQLGQEEGRKVDDRWGTVEIDYGKKRVGLHGRHEHAVLRG